MGSAISDISREHHSVRGMFGSIAPRYDLGNTVLSMGIHHLWRRKLIGMLPEITEPAIILDLCTGTGDLLPVLKKKVPHGTIVGADFCYPMLEEAARKEKVRSTKGSILQADALKLPLPDNSITAVTVAFGVRNFENTLIGLKEINRVLVPGGTLLVLEFGQPSGLFGLFYRLYSKFVMPVIGGLITGNRDAYKYLPETASRFPAGNRFLSLLQESGFKRGEVLSLTGGIACAYRASAA